MTRVPPLLRGPRGIALGLLVAWPVAAALLPNGLPLGIVVLGLVLGSLNALTAIGLVLVYRSSRIINFAQAEIGGLAASVAVIMVVGYRLPYLVALPVGLVTALLTGAVVDRVVVRRFFQAPRLILTVATVGLAQFLAGLEIKLPRLFHHVQPLTTFKTPWHVHFTISPIIFNGDHMLAMIVVPAALAALAWFLGRSDIGVAVRGAAESGERALLLGIPIRRLSTITWMVAAGLSGVGAMLSAPILGPNLGALAGPEVLLAPLAAAVVARLESLPVAVATALGIGVVQQGVFWSYPRSSTVDLILFALVLGALLFQRRPDARVDDADLGGYEAVRQVRPIPQALAGLMELRLVALVVALVLGGVIVLVPLWLSRAQLILAAFMAIYAIMAVSLVVLTGWAGQISLGQFAFAGVGAAATGSLLVHAGIDLFVAFLAAAVVGSVTAVLIGLPALRIKGLLLAVTTLAFAVPVNTYFLNSAYFPRFTPRTVTRPPILQRFDIDNPRTFYFFCLFILVVALVLARNFRRSRVGRAVTAVRDNERGAASYGISPVKAKLTAFMFSGALAGIAGGLYVLGTRGIGFSGFAPVNSLVVFTMVVIGGLGSLTGALIGAAYVQLVQYFFGGDVRLLATGGGFVVLLMIVPGGLGEIAYAVRDLLLRAVARRRGIDVPSLVREGDDEPGASAEADTTVDEAHSLLRCDGLESSYGHVQILFKANLAVGEGAIVALLGTNGAGKSTLLKVIAGIVPATSGRVVFEGTDISALSPIERLQRGVVMVPGGRGVFQSLTVGENLRLAGWLRRKDRAALATATERVVEVFPVLADRMDEPASALSGGQQQMLTLAQALLCEPKLLMIDELSLGLSPRVVATLLNVVRELNAAGTTVVLVEQSVNVATSIAQRAAFMDRGHVRFAGDLAELQAQPDLLRSVFLGAARPVAARRRLPATVATDGNGQRPPSGPRLSMAGVTRRFGGVAALTDVDIDVGGNRIIGLIGANGAGKTTLLDVCSGFLSANAGRIELDGDDITDLPPFARASRGLGRSFQDARLFPSMTVAESLAVAFDRHVDVRDPVACTLRVGATVDSEEDVSERVDALLAEMGLMRYREAFVSELSTGTRRILDLAGAVAHDPTVLLLDEPSSGIAQRESEALAEVLVELRDRTGASLVIVEHDIPLVSSIADELVCLHLGSVIARGKPKKVLDDPAVIEAYLGTDQATIARSSGRVTKRVAKKATAAAR